MDHLYEVNPGRSLILPENFGTLRFSFGRQTSRAEVEAAAAALVDAIRSLR